MSGDGTRMASDSDQLAMTPPATPSPAPSAPSPEPRDSDSGSGSDGEEELAQLAEQHCLVFELGNPAVEVIRGCMYLSDEPPPLPQQQQSMDGGVEEADDDRIEDEEEYVAAAPRDHTNRHRTCLAYLLDIPAHITLNELHSFLLESASFDSLLHMQLIRVPERSQCDPTYAALLQFASPAATSTFVDDFDGAPFNSLEPDACAAGFLVRAQFDEAERYAFPLPSSSLAHSAQQQGCTPVPSASSSSLAAPASASSPSSGPSSASSPVMPSGKQLLLAKQPSRDSISSPSRLTSIPSPSLMAGGGSSLAAANSLLLPPNATVLVSGASASDPSSSLPSCPVCLEAIHPHASVTTPAAAASAAAPHSSPLPSPPSSLPSTPMLTILCLHVFHFSCLSKWIPSSSSSSCPVCRYLLQPNVHTHCLTCKATERLWMCILCGHVGCSRYALGHARQHFHDTAHNYAIEVLTQRVWDYTADCYVHRLVRNQADGKLVELSRGSMDDDRSESMSRGTGAGGMGVAKDLSALASGSHSLHSSEPMAHGGGGGGGGAGPASRSLLSSPSPSALVVQPSSSAYASVKLEEFLLEYNYLLSSQLDQQRRIFEQQVRQVEMGRMTRKEEAEARLARGQAARDALAVRLAAATKMREESTARLESLTASHAALQTQSTQLQSLHTRLLSSHSSARSSLAASTSLYTAQQESLLAEQHATIASLEEQVHDLRFFLDTQKRIDKVDRQGRANGSGIGLRAQLNSGRAELQLVEVAPPAPEGKRSARKKKGGAGAGAGLQNGLVPL